MRNILTQERSNPKTAKSLGRGYETAILHLSPAKTSGYQVCKFATKGCKKVCLNEQGRGGIKIADRENPIQLARKERTRLFFEERDKFAFLLHRDITNLCNRAYKKDLKPAVRLNGTSDLPWERIPLFNGLTVLQSFPNVQFYDYTKDPTRKFNPEPNYHITFSLSEVNEVYALGWLSLGGNVAVVFNTKKAASLPQRWQEWPVIDGDIHDLRMLDAKTPTIIGLRAKGTAKDDVSGFVKEPN